MVRSPGSHVPAIGFLARGLEPNDTYNRKSWQTAYALAREQGVHLLMVAGYFLDAPDPRDQSHLAIYRLLNPGLIDGGILNQTVTNRATQEHLRLFARDLPPVPLVAVSIPVGTAPFVEVDNVPGLRALVRHLIDDHGCRRIVHVRGPYPNEEAAVREAVWRQELLASGIEPLPQWLVPGDFDHHALLTIGQDIVDRVGRQFDAVVACNDMAALRTLTDLQALGFRVPEDVKVVGFDDIPTCQYSAPSLTTVAQPLDLQMREAWTHLEALLEGKRRPDGTVPSTPVFRASCGCPPDRQTPGASPLLDIHDTLADVVSRYEDRTAAFRWVVYDLNNFLRDLNRVSRIDQLPAVLAEWLPRLGIPTFAVLRACRSDGRPEVWQSRTEPGTVLPTVPPWFQVLASYPVEGLEPGQLLPAEAFSLTAWLDARPPSVHGLFPLVVGQDWHGLAVFSLTPESGLLELTLQEQLASLMDRLERERIHLERNAEARAGVLAQEEGMRTLRRLVAEVAHEINTPLGAIVSSASSLQGSLAPPSSGDQALLALLAPVPGGAAPLAPAEFRSLRLQLAQRLGEWGVADAESVAEDLVDLGFRGQARDLLVPGALEEFLESVGRLIRDQEVRSSVRIIGLASQKIVNFVEKLRQLTRTRAVRDPEPTDVCANLETALLLLGADLARGVEVERLYSPVPPVLSRPDELQQVWTNLVRNAVQAMDYQGRLVFTVAPDQDLVRVDITDSGPGVPPEILDQIFTPFFTTKPEGEGLGLGLDISRAIVEGIGGKIVCRSVPGQTTFSVWLVARAAPQTPFPG